MFAGRETDAFQVEKRREIKEKRRDAWRRGK